MSNNQYFIQDMSKHYGLPMKLNDFGIISNTLGRQGCFFAPNTVDGYYSINSKAADVLAKTQELMFNINNKSLEKNAKTFLSVFIRELDYLDTAPNVFPKINIETEEDNIFFEWVFNADFRVGFTIVDNEKDSSWFLFLKNENITGSLSGNFEYVGYQFIIRKLLAIVLENT